MARWQVELTGHTYDLEELPGLLTAPELHVIEQDGRYLLEAEQFEALEESRAVHAAALVLLPLINGVGKLKHGSFQGVEIGHVRELDEEGNTRQHAVALPATVKIRSKVHAVLFKQGEDEPPPPPPESLESDGWVRDASSDPIAFRALALWGGPHDPMNLWKVWELLRDHSGLAIDPDLRRRFRPALNDRAVAGDEARHEVPSPQYPVDPDTMSSAEAEAFLSGLLTRWLGSQP